MSTHRECVLALRLSLGILATGASLWLGGWLLFETGGASGWIALVGFVMTVIGGMATAGGLLELRMERRFAKRVADPTARLMGQLQGLSREMDRIEADWERIRPREPKHKWLH